MSIKSDVALHKAIDYHRDISFMITDVMMMAVLYGEIVL
jgi:hypothetical protein